MMMNDKGSIDLFASIQPADKQLQDWIEVYGKERIEHFIVHLEER